MILKGHGGVHSELPEMNLSEQLLKIPVFGFPTGLGQSAETWKLFIANPRKNPEGLASWVNTIHYVCC